MIRKEILIIEDNAKFRSIIKLALKDKGYDFIEAESVNEGVAKFYEYPSAKVVLLDLSLPPYSGTDFLDKIKEDGSNHRVIILTAHEEYLAAEKARELDVFNYLPKASKSFRESLRFSVAQAFTDIDRDYLKEKNNKIVKIHNEINTEIIESKKVEEILDSLNRILTSICESVVELIGAYTCHIRLYSLSRGELFLVAFNGPNDEVKEIFKNPNGCFSGKVAKSKVTEIYQNLLVEDDFISFKEETLEETKALNNASLHEKIEEYFDSVKSAYITPITTQMFDNETDAVFNVSGNSVDFFSPEKQEIIREFVTLATTAITKAWQKKRKVEADKDYKGISKVLENISKELKDSGRSEGDTKEKIYEVFLNGVSEIIKPEKISVFLYNERTKLLDDKAEFKENRKVSPREEGHPLNEGLTGEVFDSENPIRIPNLQIGDRRKYQEHENYSKELEERFVGEIPSGKIDHYLGVPMIIGEEVIGVVQLINKKSDYYEQIDDKNRWLLERGFSNDCENVLGIAASHLAVSIKNAEFLEEEKLLRDAGRYISAETPLEDLLKQINDEAAKDVNAEVCLMFLIDESKTKVVLEQSFGIPKENLKKDGVDAFYEIGDGLTGEVAKTGESKVEKADEIIGKYDKEILDYFNKNGKNHSIKSLMVVPIKAKDEILGVIKAINLASEDEQFGEDNLKFFEIFANYAGIAIKNTQHTEKLSNTEKNTALSHLVRAVVHEIRNTEGVIPANVTAIRKSIFLSKYEINGMLELIEEASNDTLNFINDIDGFSAGKMKKRKVINVNYLLKSYVNKQLRFVLQSKTSNYNNVALVIGLLKQPLKCSIFETPFKQIIRNIVINGYQAMEKKEMGKLEITTTIDFPTRTAIIKFSDTGQGIKPNNLERIFEPEFTTKPNGNGIGLWLVKNHLDIIGGEIKVESKVNVGSTFTIHLPLFKNNNDEKTN